MKCANEMWYQAQYMCRELKILYAHAVEAPSNRFVQSPSIGGVSDSRKEQKCYRGVRFCLF
jgi:hypothetical protein